jgi:hypothetical protein
MQAKIDKITMDRVDYLCNEEWMMDIDPWEPEVERPKQPDLTEIIYRFRDFLIAAKNYKWKHTNKYREHDLIKWEDIEEEEKGKQLQLEMQMEMEKKEEKIQKQKKKKKLKLERRKQRSLEHKMKENEKAVDLMTTIEADDGRELIQQNQIYEEQCNSNLIQEDETTEAIPLEIDLPILIDEVITIRTEPVKKDMQVNLRSRQESRCKKEMKTLEKQINYEIRAEENKITSRKDKMKKEENSNTTPLPINRNIQMNISSDQREKKIREIKPPTRCKEKILNDMCSKRAKNINEDQRDNQK